MSGIELFFIAVGLSMDASAAAICQGLYTRTFKHSRLLLVATLFAVAQAVMPMIGYLIGQRFYHLIAAVDHWVAFGLLFLIGGKMAWEAIFKKEDLSCEEANLTELLLLAIATSIDALAVGITFAILPGLSIVSAVLTIGIITFIICAVSFWLGCKFGNKWQHKAELLGGIILMIIGIRILVTHIADHGLLN